MNCSPSSLVATVFVAALAASASAATLVSNAADGTVNAASVVDTGSFNAQAGQLGTDRAAVFVFQLPTLAVNQAFASANLATMLFGQNVLATQHGDLYGLARVSATPAINAADYYVGLLDPTATLLQNDLYTSTSPGLGTVINTDTTGDAALTAFLNTQYAGGLNAGRYVYLRISSDVDVTGDFRFDILTANAGGASERPTITYDVATVPEPAMLAGAGAGVLGLLARRRR